jgi:hypothetical protein
VQCKCQNRKIIKKIVIKTKNKIKTSRRGRDFINNTLDRSFPPPPPSLTRLLLRRFFFLSPYRYIAELSSVTTFSPPRVVFPRSVAYILYYRYAHTNTHTHTSRLIITRLPIICVCVYVYIYITRTLRARARGIHIVLTPRRLHRSK